MWAALWVLLWGVRWLTLATGIVTSYYLLTHWWLCDGKSVYISSIQHLYRSRTHVHYKCVTFHSSRMYSLYRLPYTHTYMHIHTPQQFALLFVFFLVKCTRLQKGIVIAVVNYSAQRVCALPWWDSSKRAASSFFLLYCHETCLAGHFHLLYRAWMQCDRL